MENSDHPEFRHVDWPFVPLASRSTLRRIDTELRRTGPLFQADADGNGVLSWEDSGGSKTSNLQPTPIRAQITGQVPGSPWYAFFEETFFNDTTTLTTGDWTFTYAGGFGCTTPGSSGSTPYLYNAAELNGNTSVPIGTNVLLWPMEDGASWGFYFSSAAIGMSSITTTDNTNTDANTSTITFNGGLIYTKGTGGSSHNDTVSLGLTTKDTHGFSDTATTSITFIGTGSASVTMSGTNGNDSVTINVPAGTALTTTDNTSTDTATSTITFAPLLTYQKGTGGSAHNDTVSLCLPNAENFINYSGIQSETFGSGSSAIPVVFNSGSTTYSMAIPSGTCFIWFHATGVIETGTGTGLALLQGYLQGVNRPNTYQFPEQFPSTGPEVEYIIYNPAVPNASTIQGSFIYQGLWQGPDTITLYASAVFNAGQCFFVGPASSGYFRIC